MIVDRMEVAVLPDASKLQPALKKYLQSIRPTVTAKAEVADGFLSQMQRDVSAAMRQLEADVPLTADGERLRRDARERAARIRSQLARLALDTPLDLDAAALARADVAAEVDELETVANGGNIAVGLNVEGPGLRTWLVAAAIKMTTLPVNTGASALASLIERAARPGLGGGGIVRVAAVVAVASVVTALPALLSSFVLPVGVVALGWDGITEAAAHAAPGLASLRQAVSARFLQDLAPTFTQLGESLPQLIPSFTALAGALSGAFAGLAQTLTSPEGLAKVNGIIDSITAAVETLAPAMASALSTFLDFALVGTKAFADNSPQLLPALQLVVGAMSQFIDSPLGGALLLIFTTAVTAGVALAGAATTALIGLPGTWQWVMQFAHSMAVRVGTLVQPLVAKLASLPGLIAVALASLGTLLSLLVTNATTTMTSSARSGVQLVGVAFGLLPGLIVGALAGLGALLSGLVRTALLVMTSSARAGVQTIVALAASLPALVITRVSTLPSTLNTLATTATASIASGISSGMLLLTGAMATIATRIAAHFPGSPVKVGPLTAWNHAGGTEGAGRRLIQDLARGLDSGRRDVGLSASRTSEVVAGMALQRKGYDRITGQPMHFTTQRTPGAGSTVKDLRNVIYSAVYDGTAGKRRPTAAVARRGERR